MALVMPTLQDGAAFDGMCVEDEVDIFARTSADLGTSVISGCQVLQNPLGPNMQVIITPGVVTIQSNQYSYGGTGLTPLTVPTASAGDRRDTVVLRAVFNAATPYLVPVVIQGTVPSGLVGAWTRNTNPATALPPMKGPLQWPLATPQTSVDVTTDVVLAEVYVPFNATSITGTALSIINPTTGNIVDKTGQSTNVQGEVQLAAWQNLPRRGGNIGAATSADTVSTFPYGQFEIAMGDSIATFFDASSVPRSWYGLLGVRENRLLNLPDPGGFQFPTAFSAIGASLTNVQGLGKRSTSLLGYQLTGTINSTTATNSLTDTTVFSRVLIFYVVTPGTGDGIGVSYTGGGGAVTATIDPNVITSGGNSQVAFFDSGVVQVPGVVGANNAPNLSLTRVTHVTGTGGLGATVLGYIWYSPGNAGAQGLTTFSIAEGGLTSSDYVYNTTTSYWLPFMWALGSSVRRVHIRLGGNDVILARTYTNCAFNNSNVLTSASGFTTGDIGRPLLNNVNIPAGTVIQYVTGATTAYMSNPSTGGNLSSQTVTLGQTPVTTTQANLTTAIGLLRKNLPNTEIAFFGEYQPYNGPSSSGGLDIAGYLNPTQYANTIVPMFQTVAYTNNCTYVDMFTRFGSIAHVNAQDVGLTISSPIVTSNVYNFCQGHVGAIFNGPSVPNGTFIQSVQSPTRATMSNSATASGGSSNTSVITAASVSAFTLTVTCPNSYKAGDQVLLSGLNNAPAAFNGAIITIATANSTQFTATVITGGGTAATTGLSTPSYTLNNDVYGLSADQGLHFGDSTTSASGQDGQRAHADEIWERLGYTKEIPVAPALVSAAGPWAYVVQGCIWTPDAVGSTLLASMTWGQVVIKGKLLNVNPVISRAFTANMDTYIDATDAGNGTATLTYSTVANNGLSPALASSGTMNNTIRIGVILAGATSITAGHIVQGSAQQASSAVALGSSTVAIGSNGSTIATTPLNVASGASFSTGGGWAQVNHGAGNQTYTIQFTGVSGNTLTGVTVISGTPSATVSTGDTVGQVQCCAQGTATSGPLGITDFLGNLIYPNRPTPGMIGYAGAIGGLSTTATAAVPHPGLIAPFVIPPGTSQRVKMTLHCVSVISTATAGTVVGMNITIGNSLSGAITVNTIQLKTSVASDGPPVTLIGSSSAPLAPGSYTAQVNVTGGATGTLTTGTAYITNYLSVELI